MIKLKRISKNLLLITPLIFLTGCMGGQGLNFNFDLNAFLKNPIVMIIIGAIVLWFAFRGSGKH